jgi:hypothetical protein
MATSTVASDASAEQRAPPTLSLRADRLDQSERLVEARQPTLELGADIAFRHEAL